MKPSRALLCLLPLLLGSCQWLDDLGEHMPVIGKRCEHWECFSGSGQEKSETLSNMKNGSGEQQQIAPPPENRKPIGSAPPANNGPTPYNTVTPDNVYSLPPVPVPASE